MPGMARRSSKNIDVEAALFERPAELLVVARGQEAVLGGRMPPRAGVDRGVAGLHEPHQRHLPLLLWPSYSPLRAAASGGELVCEYFRYQTDHADRAGAGGRRAAGPDPHRTPAARATGSTSTRSRAEFGISRTPVREALLELSYEGLVAITPRSGMAVVGITPQDAVDNFAILAALGGKAAEMATERVTPAELRRAAPAGRRRRRPTTWWRPTGRFHRAINHAARSPRLLTYLRQAVRVVPANFFELFPEQEQRSHEEHAALLEAMARRRRRRRPGTGRAARARLPARPWATWLAARGADAPPRPIRLRAPAAGARLRRLEASSRSMLARSSGEVNDRSSAAEGEVERRPARPAPSGC